MLDRYLQTLQGFLRDRAQRNLNPDDLISYINRARREIALRTQCIRRLTPISGQIQEIQVINPGSGYITPIVTISPPDAPSGTLPNPGGAQAIAVAQVVAGKISNISVTYGGDGYFEPTVTIIDAAASPGTPGSGGGSGGGGGGGGGSGGTFVLGQSPLGGTDVLGSTGSAGGSSPPPSSPGTPPVVGGSGAIAAALVTPINVTQYQQEVYPFSAVPLSNLPGVGGVFCVNSLSLIFANYRYSLPVYPFSVYQAMIRQYPQQYLYVPTMAAQYGQGTNGSIYFYPIPAQPFQMEWDCFCLPTDLTDPNQIEPIADPWTDAVSIGAAVYAYEELQNLNSATYYQKKFDEYVHRYSAWARPGRVTNPYGRY